MLGTVHHYYIVALTALALTGCGGERPDPGREAHRVSMALRGVPPSAAELEQVREDDSAIHALARGWVGERRFEQSVMDWHAELLWLRHDTQPMLPPVGALEGEAIGAIGASVINAPLQQVALLLAEDRPYTDLFAGRQVAVDRIGARIWGLPYDQTGPDWQLSEWTDDRPPGGILVDSNVWMRHISSDTNHHRARANLVHRAWLCEDLSTRTLDLGHVDLTDATEVADTVRTDPGCAGCHEVLDPIAAGFTSWRRYIVRGEVSAAHEGGCSDPDFCYPLRLRSPEHTASAAQLGLPAPALAGRPVSDLAELGRALVEDPRFASCVARNYAAWVGQQDPAAVPQPEVERLATRFVSSGYDLRELALATVLAPRFSAHAGEVGPLVSRPEHVARTVEHLTGFKWMADPDAGSCRSWGCWGAVDLGMDARWGFREVSGGMDGYDSLHPVHAPQPLRHLATARLAEEAGAWVVAHEAGLAPRNRKLLREIELEETRRGPVRKQLAELHRRLLGDEARPARVDATWALWSAVLETSGSTERAWAAVISAMLQSPELGLY